MSENLSYSLQWLLNPVQPEDFLKNFWESQPLVINRKEDLYWQALLSLDTIDNIISSLNSKFPDIRIANSKEPVAPENYVVEDGLINVAKLYQYYSNGSTLILNQLQKRVPSLAYLCRAMEQEFSMPFQTNIYLTPPDSQGFGAHYDTHDVFILQIAGSKHWRIYNRPIENPLINQDFMDGDYEIGEPIQEFDLHPGDLVYIPRGVVHDAVTGKDESLHITFGALAFTWKDLLIEVVNQISISDCDFRRSLPIGFANQKFNIESIKIILFDLLQKMTSEDAIESTFNYFIDKFIATRHPILHGQLKHSKKISIIQYDKILIQRPNVLYRVKETSESIEIKCYGTKITFPINIRESVLFAITKKQFKIIEIPGEIDFELKKVIIQRLIHEGIIMFQND